MPEMRDSVDSFLTAYTSEGSDPVGYPYGQIPEYSTDDIPMAETAYGATFGGIGAPPHPHHYHRGGGWGRGPGWGGGWGWGPWYPPFEVVGTIVQPEPAILDESGEPQRDEEEKKKKGVKGLSSFVTNRLHEVARQLPQAERKMFLVEIEDPSFVVYIARFLNAADPVRGIMDDALRAIANEFNPLLYPMTRGYWNYLRGVAKKLTVNVAQMIDQQVEGMSPGQKLAVYQKFQEVGMSGGSGVGLIEELIATITSSAGKLYEARIGASTAKDIEKIKADAATKQAELQVKMAQAQAAFTPSPGAYAAPSGGIPLPLIIGGVAAAGLFAFLALKR